MENRNSADKSFPQARALPGGDYPRAHTRYASEFRMTLQVFIQEDTFALEEIHARTVDVSMRGMRIAIERLENDLYTKLLMEPRQVRIFLKIPVLEEKIKLVGRLVWMDYHKPKADQTGGLCFMGILLDEHAGTDIERYEELVREIERRAAQLP